MKRYLTLCLIIMTTACSSKYQEEPVGIGRGVNDLKQSPCACIEIKQNYQSWNTKV